MEEDWRRMAAAVAASGLDVLYSTEAIHDIEVAHRLFYLAAQVCDRFSQGLPYQRGADDALPRLHTASGHISRAIVASRLLSTSHAGSGHVFSLCSARIGLQVSAPVSWQTWRDHHANAAAHAAMALERLASAFSHASAAIGAVRVMLGTAPMQVRGGHAANALEEHYNVEQGPPTPQGLPLWDAWGRAAKQLLDRTTDELARARAELEQMRPDNVAATSEARTLLSR